MKNVTIATEKRINKMVRAGVEAGRALEVGWTLDFILGEMKTREACTGYTITQMKAWGVTLDNAPQISCCITPTMRGMSVNFESLFVVAECLDLSYVTVMDFNQLVKECYEKYMEA